MLSVEEWNKILEEALQNPTDSATVVSALTRARDEYTTGYGELASSQEELVKIKEEADRLRETNMQLFLRIGQQSADTTGSNTRPEDEEARKAETITIDELLRKE